MLKPIPKKIADYVWNRDGYQCRLCGRRLSRGEGAIHHLWERDEFFPIDIGLSDHNDPLNLILVCGECHVKLHTHRELYRPWRKDMLEANRRHR